MYLESENKAALNMPMFCLWKTKALTVIWWKRYVK